MRRAIAPCAAPVRAKRSPREREAAVRPSADRRGYGSAWRRSGAGDEVRDGERRGRRRLVAARTSRPDARPDRCARREADAYEHGSECSGAARPWTAPISPVEPQLGPRMRGERRDGAAARERAPTRRQDLSRRRRHDDAWASSHGAGRRRCVPKLHRAVHRPRRSLEHSDRCAEVASPARAGLRPTERARNGCEEQRRGNERLHELSIASGRWLRVKVEA